MAVPSPRPPVLLTDCINQRCPQPHPCAAQFAGIIHRTQNTLDLLVPFYYKGYDERYYWTAKERGNRVRFKDAVYRSFYLHGIEVSHSPDTWMLNAFTVLKDFWAPLIKNFYGGSIILELLIKPLVIGDWIQFSGPLHSMELGFGTEIFNPVILPWSLCCPAHPPSWRYLGLEPPIILVQKDTIILSILSILGTRPEDQIYMFYYITVLQLSTLFYLKLTKEPLGSENFEWRHRCVLFNLLISLKIYFCAGG